MPAPDLLTLLRVEEAIENGLVGIVAAELNPSNPGTAGTFVIKDHHANQTTNTIAYNASAATVQTRIRADLSTNYSSATVSGNAGGPWTVDQATASLNGHLSVNAGSVTPSGTVGIVNITRTGTASLSETCVIRLGAVQVVRSRDVPSKVTPRVEILLSLGEVTNRIWPATYEHYEWNAALIMRIVSSRHKAADGSRHDELLGRVRLMCRPSQAKFTTTLLPYHQVGIIKEAGCPHSVDTDADEQDSSLNFETRVNIRDDGWPA